jgi:hypothetical protein
MIRHNKILKIIIYNTKQIISIHKILQLNLVELTSIDRMQTDSHHHSSI